MPRVSRHLQWATVGLAVLLCVQLVARHAGTSQDGRQRPPLRSGEFLPNGTFADQGDGGSVHSLSAIFRDRNVPCALVIYFRSTCSACQALAPAWADSTTVLVQEIRMPVLWVGGDRDASANAFLQEHHLPGRTISHSDWSELGIPFVPYGHIVDRSGVLVTATAVKRDFLGRTPNPELQMVAQSCTY